VRSPRARALLVNAGLALVSIAVVLTLLEGAARLAERSRGGGKERDEASRYVEHDPRLGWRKKPGARVRYDRREYTTEVAINSNGLRDPERAYAAAPGTFRILALGDSFVEGYTVDMDRTVTQVLENALGGPGCPVEVLNGGTHAYSTDQEYLFYLDQGVRYSPQVVLLFAYYNDVLWNLAVNYYGSPKPLLKPVGDRLVLSNDPVPVPYRGPTPAPPPPPPAPKLRSAAFEWAKDRLARGAPRAFNMLARTGLWERMGGDEPDDQMRVFKRRQQPLIETAWERTDAILRALSREAAARGTRFALVYVPSRMEVSDRDWELTRLAYDLDEKAWDLGLVARRFAEIGASAGFPLIDLTPDLRRASRGVLGEPYFVHDGHWNAVGHRVAAEAIERFLRERGWAPPCAPRL
jgi:acetyltransferase AlgX (SGNH hydrolase-like protein)